MVCLLTPSSLELSFLARHDYVSLKSYATRFGTVTLCTRIVCFSARSSPEIIAVVIRKAYTRSTGDIINSVQDKVMIMGSGGVAESQDGASKV